MKAFIIRIKDNARSVESALQTYNSAKQHNFDVEYFDAYTPKDNPVKLFNADNIKFFNKKILTQPEIACWYSHYSLWKKACEYKEPILILEHDAIVKRECPDFLKNKTFNNIPDNISFVINVTKPYFGDRKKIKATERAARRKEYYFGKLKSKQPGACGYIINKNIIYLIDYLKSDHLRITHAVDSTLFYSKRGQLAKDIIKRYEYYPWFIECIPAFTTIQRWKKDTSKSKDPSIIINKCRTDQAPLIDPDTGNIIKATVTIDKFNSIIFKSDE